VSLDVEIDGASRQVIIRFGGIDACWAFAREQRLPLDVIAGVIDTSLERPCRVVLQTPDRGALAQRTDQLTKGART